MTDMPRVGEVWTFPYLWARQARAGETEGRKPRPSAVAIVVRRRDGRHGIVFLAVTSQPPSGDRLALKVPETERQRAGLAKDKDLWIVMDEHNTDVAETSFYLEPDGRVGQFSERFIRLIQAGFLDALRHRKSLRVDRTDD